MEIQRHCKERLRYGERIWRDAAKEAEFKGILVVDGLGRRKWNRSEIHSPRRKEFGVTRAIYTPTANGGKIIVFVYNAPCADPAAAKGDAFLSFLHELGHHRQFVRGVYHPSYNDASNLTKAQWRADIMEISAERYMRRQAAKYGFKGIYETDR